MASKKPVFYQKMKKQHPAYFEALESLGEAVRKAGPLEDKAVHLVQLAGAAAMRSEGAVHSHTRRALEAGASAEEVCARSIRALRRAGARHLYVSNLPVGRARQTLSRIMALAA